MEMTTADSTFVGGVGIAPQMIPKRIMLHFTVGRARSGSSLPTALELENAKKDIIKQLGPYAWMYDVVVTGEHIKLSGQY